MRRRFVVLAGISTAWWAASGVVGATRYHRMRAESGTPTSWSQALRSQLGTALLWVPFTMLSLWLTERYPLGRPTARAAAAHAGGLAAVIAGRAAAVKVGNRLGRWHETVPPGRELILRSTLNNAFEYAMITGVAHAVHYAREYRVRETQLAQARLAALRAQIRPHFLFNALNTIAAAVPDDPIQAEQMIVQLGALLRRSLASDGAAEITLRDELAVVRAYLGIEQARFGDRLAVAWSIGPEVLDAAVPALALQPLVENAVRHGLSPRPDGGRVRITARRFGDRLRLRVADDGVGMPPDPTGDGLGLSNVRARLGALYGPRHSLRIGRPDAGRGRGTVVVITLPYRALVT